MLSPVNSQGSFVGKEPQQPGSPGKSCCQEPRRRGLGSLYPLPAITPPPCQGREGGREAFKLAGGEDVILHLPGFWEGSIKIDMFSVCFNASVLDFAVPDEHARKFLTSCTVNTEH